MAVPVASLAAGDRVQDLRTGEYRSVAEVSPRRSGVRVHYVDGGSSWFRGTELRVAILAR